MAAATGRGHASSAAVAVRRSSLARRGRGPRVSISAATPRPQWWRWPRSTAKEFLRLLAACGGQALEVRRKPLRGWWRQLPDWRQAHSLHWRFPRRCCRLGPKATFGVATSPAALAAVGVAAASRPHLSTAAPQRRVSACSRSRSLGRGSSLYDGRRTRCRTGPGTLALPTAAVGSNRGDDRDNHGGLLT